MGCECSAQQDGVGTSPKASDIISPRRIPVYQPGSLLDQAICANVHKAPILPALPPPGMLLSHSATCPHNCSLTAPSIYTAARPHCYSSRLLLSHTAVRTCSSSTLLLSRWYTPPSSCADTTAILTTATQSQSQHCKRVSHQLSTLVAQQFSPKRKLDRSSQCLTQITPVRWKLQRSSASSNWSKAPRVWTLLRLLIHGTLIRMARCVTPLVFIRIVYQC